MDLKTYKQVENSMAMVPGEHTISGGILKYKRVLAFELILSTTHYFFFIENGEKCGS